VPAQYNTEYVDTSCEDNFMLLTTPKANGGNCVADLADRDIYILDFSFPRSDMDKLFARAKRVVWLDHHKTAFEMWCPEEKMHYLAVGGKHHILLDNNKSGAMLTWEYFHPDTEVPMLIKHIDDYDRWVFALEGTKELNKALWSRPFDFKAWKTIYFEPGYEKNALEYSYREGAAILRAHNQNVQSVVKGMARKCSFELPGHHCEGLAANCNSFVQSDVGHELANLSKTFGLLWSLDKDGKCKCSLRSNGNYDVSAIAKTFGGGGHKNAAGFEVPLTQLLGWLK